MAIARALALAAALLAVAGATSGQTAASFPSRPVRFMVPLTPGGSPDVMARTIAQRLQEV